MLHRVHPVDFIDLLIHTTCKRDKNKAGLNKNFDFVIYDSIAPPVVTKPFVPATIIPYFDHGKWGYADRQGDVVIRCQYDECGFFAERFAWVSKDKKYYGSIKSNWYFRVLSGRYYGKHAI